MTVRSRILLLPALMALLIGAGCGGNDPNPVASETDDATYLQGKQMLKQGRTPEALAAFLKVIERRGEQSSAESHLDAGIIYLKESKDPVEAYHHFRQYLALQPNSKQAPYVRELIENARREFARTLPAQSLDGQTSRFELPDQTLQLRRENDELRAQLDSFQRGLASGVSRTTRSPVNVETLGVRAVVPTPVPEIITPAADSPITLAPLPGEGSSPIANAAPPTAAVPLSVAPTRPAQVVNRLPPTRSTATPPAVAGRRYRVAAKDSLFGIAQKFYGVASMAKARAIYEANRDVMKSEGDLRAGMEIKIP